MIKEKDNTIEVTGECCTGCNACALVCPRNAIWMEENQKGFKYPYLDEGKCVNCGECRKVCPVLAERQGDKFEKRVYAVKVKELKKRRQSQSGGAFTAFAEQILKEGGVVYGVSLNDKNDAVYARCTQLSQLSKLKKSKYVEARMNDIYAFVKDDLIVGREVLICGTPCAMTALRKYLDYCNIDMKKLLLCDLICHGVPSTKIFKNYLQLIEWQYGRRVKDFDFRDKLRGNWWGHVCSFRVGIKRIISENYVKIFYSHLCLRESCYFCKFASLDRCSDVTLGDYWGIEKIVNGFADRDGVSVCIIHSSKGNTWFEKISENIEYMETKVEDCLQPNLVKPTDKPNDYDGFWDVYENKGFEAAAFQYCNYDPKSDYVYKKKRLIKKFDEKKAN